MHVLLQFRHSPPLHEAAVGGSDFAPVAPDLNLGLSAVRVDARFSPVQVPAKISMETRELTFALNEPVEFSLEPERSTYLVRGEVSDDPASQNEAYSAAFADPAVVGVWADPLIETFPVNCAEPAVGTSGDVAALLNVKRLAEAGMTGAGVDVAVVDGGINVSYLRGNGVTAKLVGAGSYSPAGAPPAGTHAVGHGTMSAFDVCIAAPEARLLDNAVLTAPPPGLTRVAGYLSNAVAAYGGLLQRLRRRPARRPLVVTNSWGIYDPSSDFPAGHPGNYTDNPAHPFNVIIASLEEAGADILFAAGNCGLNCPDDRCAFPSRPITGGNSHPAVLSVAAVDVQDRRLGYSSQGPGRLMRRKPDLAAYAHFQGSGALRGQPADVGTSAACPVAAGVVAALRSVFRPSRLSPGQVRSLLCKTARDLGPSGWDPDFGWGVIDPPQLIAALESSASTRRRKPRPRRRARPTRRG